MVPLDSALPRLEVRAVSKRFGATLALDRVDFDLAPGEIHALLGENGAGKSTLMNILCGLIAPTDGQIVCDGHPLSLRSPEDAARAGIGMVHQHFLLVPAFSVAENLALAARSRTRGWRLDTRPIAGQAAAVAARLGWPLSLQARVADLPVGAQQRVEILKALLGEARILLFDEPTATLAPPEVEELFVVLRALRAEGRSLVFVSHKLREVMALCDRVTVLRRGRAVGTLPTGRTDPEDLARRMVGDDAQAGAAILEAREPAARPDDAPPVLSLHGLSAAGGPDAVALHGLSFAVRPGEILGFAGVDGNGQAELAEVLTGRRVWTAGSLSLHGEPIRRLRPTELAERGIALIPPDRHREGLALGLSVAENLMLEAASLPRFRRGPFLDRGALRRFAEQTAQEFDIRAGSLDSPAGSLSGGNQQKIVIARALWRKPALLVAASPTRGLDVAAAGYVHDRLRERRQEGGAIVLLSTELDEIVALSDRIAVLYEGRLVGIVSPDAPRRTLGLMMGGTSPEERDG